MHNKKSSVLYIDDESYNLTAFMAEFRRYYNVFTTTSVREAIEILQKNDIDLIITDQRMPEMTGVQFLEAVIAEFPKPARMILTGYSDIDAITKAINNGAVLRYITKPWDPAELKQIIDMGIRVHELEESERQLIKHLETNVEKQNQAIELFKKYVPENIFRQVVGSQQEPHIISDEGEFRIISVLFADIRDFTRFSEKLDAKTLVDYLNSYFTVMINCVTKNQGYVYKLMGDGLIATFGAPTSSIYNQRNAVFCALDMMEALKEFNRTTASDFQHETFIGIGINTGETIVGHIITENFMSYEAIGETVDKASRIQDLTRSMPNTILMSEATYNAVKNDVLTSEMTEIEDHKVGEKVYKVIGKRKP